jgi:hypothetical protein
VKLSINKPGFADVTFEALGMPVAALVLEIAHTGGDSFFAAVTLTDGFHAIGADDVIIDDEISLFDQVFLAAFAHKTLIVVVFSLDCELLLLEAYGLLTSMAFRGTLFVTTLTKQLSLVNGVRFFMKFGVAFDATVMLFVPVLLVCFSELA